MTTPSYPRLLLLATALLAASCVHNADVSLAPPAGPIMPNRDVTPALPVIPNHTFSLADYGAKGNGYTMNTDAFKSAVAAVDAAGGGTLDIPKGTYLTGAFDLCSGINLHLEANATILFSPDPEEYRNGGRFRPLISASNLHDVMISGNGTINGSGEAWWPAARIFKAEANDKLQRSNTSPRPVPWHSSREPSSMFHAPWSLSPAASAYS